MLRWPLRRLRLKFQASDLTLSSSNRYWVGGGKLGSKWYEKFEKEYASGANSVFIFSLNETSAYNFLVNDFLKRRLRDFRVAVTFNYAKGLTPETTLHGRDLLSRLAMNRGKALYTEAWGVSTTSSTSSPALNQVKLLDFVIRKYPTFLLVEDANRLIPRVELGHSWEEERRIAAYVERWTKSNAVKKARSVVCLLTPAPEDLDKGVASHAKVIMSPLPSSEERKSAIELLMGQWREARWEAPVESYVQASAGLRTNDITDALTRERMDARLANRPISPKSLVEERAQKLTRYNLEVEEAKFGFEAVGGLEMHKKILRRAVINKILYKEDLSPFGVAHYTGVLFAGPSGTGKSLLAECMAKEANCVFVRLQMGKIVTSWFGESERNMLMALRATESLASPRSPVIVFIDEISTMLPQQASSDSNATSQRLLGTLLEFQGKIRNVIYIAASNRPDLLDFALISRYPVRLPLLAPDRNTREKILEVQTNIHHPMVLAEDVNFGEIAEKTEGLMGRDLENLVLSAGDIAAEKYLSGPKREKRAHQEDFMEALRTFKPSQDPQMV